MTAGLLVATLAALASRQAAPVPFPYVDLSGDKSQDVVIAAGTETVYQGHPTTVMTADGRFLGDGTLLTTTNITYWDDRRQQSVVSNRFRLPAFPHVVAKIADCDRFAPLNPHFKKAFAFLKRTDLADLPLGRHEIDGDNCWAMVQEAKLSPLVGAKLEAHRRYIDIQAPLTGPETFGLARLSEKQSTPPFNVEKDFVLFEAPTRPVTLQPGDFAIFFPPDGAHAPGHATGAETTIRKLVIKVKAE